MDYRTIITKQNYGLLNGLKIIHIIDHKHKFRIMLIFNFCQTDT